MTTIAKKMGGPLRLFGLVFGGGAVLGGGTVLGFEAIKKKASKIHDERKQAAEAATVHTVIKEGNSNEGLLFNVGDKFRILERDGDAALIERLDDGNNPYFVSAQFLSSISDYRMA